MTENTTNTALVTGASRGLGLALARRLAREGWTLIIDARVEDALESARAELSEHTRVVAIPGDVTDPEHRRMLAWYGGPYDPDDLDLPLIRRRFGVLADRRAAGQAAYAKSRRKG